MSDKAAVDFFCAERALSPTGFDAAAQVLCTDIACVRAVIEVETGGTGYDTSGRLKMLFEPHVFYRLLDALPNKVKLGEACANGVAYAAWGERPYPDNSYPRLAIASRIDTGAALSACSWGLGQIMGLNYRRLGYTAVIDMIRDAQKSEDVQLEQMVKFIIINGIASCLRERNWTAFAARYNGSRNVEIYAGRLADAYAKFTTVVNNEVA